MADRYGGKRLFGGCILISSVISLLTPPATRAHFGVLLLLRVFLGLCDGFLYPAAHALIARWSASKYRSTVVTLIFSGTSVGIVAGLLLSGVLCDYGFAGGWPSVFYVFGMVGCVWSLAWFLLCYDSPATHPRISTTEREYWERVIGTTELVARPPTPWRNILTSLPVWALTVAYFAYNWGFNTLQTWIPVFMRDVLGFNMTNSGVFTAVPFLAKFFIVPLGCFADWLRSPDRLSTNVVRKIYCATGFFLAACLLSLVGYIGCNRTVAVSLMFLFMCCMSMTHPVVIVNQLDLAPLHAGKIMGLTKFVGTVASMVVPYVAGVLTYYSSTRSEWQKVFFLAAGIQTVGAIVFVVFGSGHQQSWAGLTDETINVQRQSDDTVHVDVTSARQSGKWTGTASAAAQGCQMPCYLISVRRQPWHLQTDIKPDMVSDPMVSDECTAL